MENQTACLLILLLSVTFFVLQPKAAFEFVQINYLYTLLFGFRVHILDFGIRTSVEDLYLDWLTAPYYIRSDSGGGCGCWGACTSG